jgi:hypothetical protein
MAAIPVALFPGVIGAVSVRKAVHIDKRELRCTCIGGDTNGPLGFVSLTGNSTMLAMRAVNDSWRRPAANGPSGL